MRRVTLKAGLISFVVCAMLAGVAPMAAAAATPKAAGGLGAAAGFAVLANGTKGLNCTNSTVIGPVGVGSSGTPIVQVGCALKTQVAPGAYGNFLNAYGANLAACDRSFTDADTLAGLSLAAGTYCFPAGATLTGTLTLTGSGPWLFQIGTGGTGGLTTTDLNVVGSNPCNATWWVRDAATFTTSAFQGTILTGKDITLTDTSLTGRALATGAVTLTRSHILGCTGSGTVAKPGPLGKGELNAAACNAVGKPVIDVNEKVLNEADSGTAGNAWAYDTYSRHIQVWQTGTTTTGATTWCAVVTYKGKFTTIAGASPGNTAVIAANVKGDFSGGYRATFTGTLLGTPLGTPPWRTHGSVGTVNYACDTSFNCPGYVDWVGQYFTYSNFVETWWGWSYKASGHHGTWVNSIAGNSGDIF
jgi:hypothetical protein